MHRAVNPPRGTDPSRARDGLQKLTSKVSPITPAITGISFPSPTDTRSDRGREHLAMAMPVTSALSANSSSDDTIQPATPTGWESLDQLWSSLRQQKERKMAKEPSKIESFVETLQAPEPQVIHVPSRPPPSSHPSVKKKRSMYVASY